jgi:hypothetical protein
VLNDDGWTHLEMTPPKDAAGDPAARQSGLFDEDS